MLNVRFHSPCLLTPKKSSDTFHCGNILTMANRATLHPTDIFCPEAQYYCYRRLDKLAILRC